MRLMLAATVAIVAIMALNGCAQDDWLHDYPATGQEYNSLSSDR